MSSDSMKLCKDCRWYQAPVPGDPRRDEALCCHPNADLGVNPVDGVKVGNTCSFERSEEGLWTYIFGICGKQGRWFEAKS